MVEQILTEWIPTDPAEDWLWERRFTGAERWLAGSVERAREHGVDVTPRWPTGRWQAPFGDYFAAGSGRSPRPHPGGWQRPNAEFLEALPRDPQLLLARLDEDSPPARPGYCGPLQYARDALRTGRVPAPLRATLCEALQLVPDLVVERARNVSGRQGVAFVHEDEVRRTEVIIDQDDGCFLGERDIMNQAMAEHGVAAGTTIAETAVTTGAAATLGAHPLELA
ncbi:hypothetical protein ACL02T_19515 [Pseudonocardia sp. RS010]|uniref:hypothetical protein n=1 Tax=Pseudonocardia sp. RS010 TaxID=3385979 RepID=UPI0039A1005F